MLFKEHFPKLEVMHEKKQLSAEEYLQALERMKMSPRDRIGILGEMGAVGLGGIAGIGVAGATASAAGIATLFGSSTLASILGGVFVTTTPVGWVVGSIGVGCAVGYGISKLARSGGKSDAIRKMNMRELSERIQKMRNQTQYINKHDDKMRKIIEGIQLLIKNQKISQEESTQLLTGIEKGNITIDLAFESIQDILALQDQS